MRSDIADDDRLGPETIAAIDSVLEHYLLEEQKRRSDERQEAGTDAHQATSQEPSETAVEHPLFPSKGPRDDYGRPPTWPHPDGPCNHGLEREGVPWIACASAACRLDAWRDRLRAIAEALALETDWSETKIALALDIPPKLLLDIPPPYGISRAYVRAEIESAVKDAFRPESGSRASEIEEEAIDWLVVDRIPLGMLTLIDGDPKVFKTGLLLDLCVRCVRGTAFVDATPVPQGGVVYLSADDDPSTVLRPRLRALGATDSDLDKIVFLDRFRDGHPVAVTNESDRRWLQREARRARAKLIVVDPLSSFIGTSVDTRSDRDIKRGLMGVTEVASQTKAAIVGVRHLTKDASKKALYAGQDSAAFQGVARASHLVGYAPGQKEIRVFAPIAANHAREEVKSLEFRVVEEGLDIGGKLRGVPRIEWIGVSELTANDLRAADARDRAPENKLDATVKFLRDALRNGPVLSKDIDAAAKSEGITFATLRLAKQKLKVRSFRDPNPGPWYCQLPEKL